jgi:hypothetical protein
MTERNQTSSVHNYLKQLESLQDQASFGKDCYLWPAYRKSMVSRQVLDSNIFMTASVIFILKQCLELMDDENKSLANKLINKAITEFPHYQNKDGRLSYNFWRTKPSEHFPNNPIFQRIDYLRLPDDIDDTALIALCSDMKPESAAEISSIFSDFANRKHRIIKRVPKKLQKFGAFTTFMATKMSLEFDVVAQCNALLMLYKYQLPLTTAAEQTILYISHLIENETILEDPFLTSPNYPNSAIIYYHIARLIFQFPHSKLNFYKDTILMQLSNIKIASDMDRFFVNFSSLLLGKPAEFSSFNPKTTQLFFIGGMMSGFGNTITKWLSPLKIWHVRFYSEALNIALQCHFTLLWHKNDTY